jgi:hypothetical protein
LRGAASLCDAEIRRRMQSQRGRWRTVDPGFTLLHMT